MSFQNALPLADAAREDESPQSSPATAPTAGKPRRRIIGHNTLILFGLFFMVVAARWFLAENLSSQIPLWDEWDAGCTTYKKVLAGELQFRDLLEPINEHRHLPTKVLQVATFILNDKQWDTQILITLNAFFAACIPVLLLVVLRRDPEGVPLTAARSPGLFNGPIFNNVLLGVLALLWLSPILWYNAVWAEQGAFYFVTIFALLGIHLTLGNREFSLAWWLGLVSLELSCLSLAPGLLAPVVVGATCVLRAWIRRNWLTGSRWTLGFCFIIAVVQLITAPSSPQTTDNWAHSVIAFAKSLFQHASWPWSFDLPSHGFYNHIYAEESNFFLFAPLLFLPGMVWFVVRFVIMRREQESGAAERQSLNLAACLMWSYALVLLMAVTRGKMGVAPNPRHYDVHVLSVVFNLAALMRLVNYLPVMPWISRYWRPAAAVALALYFTILGVGVVRQSLVAVRDMSARKIANAGMIENLNNYLETGDPATLEGKPIFHIAIGEPHLLTPLLDDPEIRQILPPSLGEPLSLTPLPQTESALAPADGEKDRKPNWPPANRGRTPIEVTPPASAWALGPLSRSYLQIPYCRSAEVGVPFELTLESADGRGATHKADLGIKPQFGWGTAHVKVGEGPQVLRASAPTRKGKFVILAPVEVGRLSYLLATTPRKSTWCLALGIFLCTLGFMSGRLSPVEGS